MFHNKLFCIYSQYYFSLLCSCHCSYMLHIFSLENNPLLCGFAQAGFANAIYFSIVLSKSRVIYLEQMISLGNENFQLLEQVWYYFYSTLSLFLHAKHIIQYNELCTQMMNWCQITLLLCNRQFYLVHTVVCLPVDVSLDREEIYDSPAEKANGSHRHFPALWQVSWN